MDRLALCVMVAALVACGNKERAGSPPDPGSNAPPVSASGAATQPAPAAPATASDEVAQRVLEDLASNAFGNQKVERRCVNVSTPEAAGTSTVASAKLLDDPSCGDATARRMLWIYVRPPGGAWDEQFLANPPPCWKDVPAEIVDAVAKTTGIAKC
jgi:hypothetical protein